MFRDREAVVDGTGESHEHDFDIPIGYAIRIYAVHQENHLGDQDGAAITVEQFLDLDGAELASDAISTQALFEARETNSSVIAALHSKHDAVTSGAAIHSQDRFFVFPEPILTARNPGSAFLSMGASGECFVGIYYKWVRISDVEFAQLVAARRA